LYYLAFLDVKDRTGRIPLREDCLFLKEVDAISPFTDSGKKLPCVEVAVVLGQPG
jgi:hypothetical protein